MRASLSGLFACFFMSSIACAADSPISSAPRSDIPDQECELFLTRMNAALPTQAQRIQLVADGRQLELKANRSLAADNRVSSVTAVRQLIQFERLMMLLATGSSTDEIMSMMTPLVDETMRGVDRIDVLLAHISEMKARSELTENEALEFKVYENNLVLESQDFGRQYAAFKAAMDLLISVAQGHGVDSPFASLPIRDPNHDGEVRAAILEVVKTPIDDKPARPADVAVPVKPTTVEVPAATMVYRLSDPSAIHQAQRILELLNPQVERSWVQLSPPPADGSESAVEFFKRFVAQVEFKYRYNWYARIGYLQGIVEDQSKLDEPIRRLVTRLSEFYLNQTAYDFIPERYRKVMLKLAMIGYDTLMLERHLGPIQRIVEISRVRQTNGDVVLLNDQEILGLQLRRLNSLVGDYNGNNDLLITFARLSFHMDAWANLINFVAAKAEASPKGSDVYRQLLERMKNAEARAKELGPLSYIYEPSKTQGLSMIGMSAVYLFVVEQLSQHYLAGPLYSTVTTLFPVAKYLTTFQ